MKSHVGMEQHQCPICLVKFDTGNILLETRIDPRTRTLCQTLDDHVVTGYSPCPDCQAKLDDDYIALVETRDPNPGRSTIGIDVPRSGNFAFVERKAFSRIFDMSVPDPPMVFVEPGVIDKIRSMTEGGGTKLPSH